jgi:hypothetical protein
VAWRDTHPPLEARIRTLLGIAHVSPAEFERQAAQAGEHFEAGALGACARAERRSSRLRPSRSRSLPQRLPLAAHSGHHSRSSRGAAQTGRASPSPASMTCPPAAPTSARAYEGIDIVACERCGGRLVSTPQVGKLLAPGGQL